LPPDQCQDSAVTYVAPCVVSAIAIKKRFYMRAWIVISRRMDSLERWSVRNL
ncbi:hypothetical protein GIV31_28065, partial [Pseudomonas syringae]|nr:hypothetical protein [Pseudomonas syringae]